MKKIFVIFKKQEGEIKNAYSLVDEEILPNLPQNQILSKQEVEDKLYTTEELDTLRDEGTKNDNSK